VSDGHGGGDGREQDSVIADAGEPPPHRPHDLRVADASRTLESSEAPPRELFRKLEVEQLEELAAESQALIDNTER